MLSSVEEVLVAAENLLATPPPQDSIEGKADEQDDDSLNLGTCSLVITDL